MHDLSVDNRNRLLRDSSDQFALENPAQIVINSIANAVENIVKSFIPLGRLDGFCINKFGERARLKLEDF